MSCGKYIILPGGASPVRCDLLIRLLRGSEFGSVDDSIAVEVDAVKGPARDALSWLGARHASLGVLRQEGLATARSTKADAVSYKASISSVIFMRSLWRVRGAWQ